jgi:hypothetical protein
LWQKQNKIFLYCSKDARFCNGKVWRLCILTFAALIIIHFASFTLPIFAALRENFKRCITFNKYIFFLLFVVSCHSKEKNSAPQKAPPPIVDVIVAQPQSRLNTIEANGTVVANEFVELHPEATGPYHLS